MNRADSRPRIHIWPQSQGVAWSLGPCATRQGAPDHGSALNTAIGALAARAAKGVVVIVEPPT